MICPASWKFLKSEKHPTLENHPLETSIWATEGYFIELFDNTSGYYHPNKASVFPLSKSVDSKMRNFLDLAVRNFVGALTEFPQNLG